MTLKDLSDLKLKHDRTRYASVPAHAIGRTAYTDKTANGLAKAIKVYCEIKNVWCERTGSEGRYRPGKMIVDVVGRGRQMKGTWLPGNNVGQGDLQIIIKGKTYSVEIKIGKDRQSDVQKQYQAKLESAGGVYVIVKSWDDFWENFKNLI